jgi:hypothetical protein
MSWASGYVERLGRGDLPGHRVPLGAKIDRLESGQLCTVEPVVLAEVIESTYNPSWKAKKKSS